MTYAKRCQICGAKDASPDTETCAPCQADRLAAVGVEVARVREAAIVHYATPRSIGAPLADPQSIGIHAVQGRGRSQARRKTEVR